MVSKLAFFVSPGGKMRKKVIQFLGFDGRRRMDSATYVIYVRYGGSMGQARVD